jgi:hypothetical protein
MLHRDIEAKSPRCYAVVDVECTLYSFGIHRSTSRSKGPTRTPLRDRDTPIRQSPAASVAYRESLACCNKINCETGRSSAIADKVKGTTPNLASDSAFTNRVPGKAESLDGEPRGGALGGNSTLASRIDSPLTDNLRV